LATFLPLSSLVSYLTNLEVEGDTMRAKGLNQAMRAE
jgi:hypothetical protein